MKGFALDSDIVGLIQQAHEVWEEEAEIEAWTLGSHPDFIPLMERFRERGQREGRMTLEEVRRQLGIPPRG